MPYAGNIWFEEAGAGRPILFVHGWCMSASVWKFQRDAVAVDNHFLALDLRGHGSSSASSSGACQGFAGYAQDIVSLVKQLQLTDLVIVGWSMGGQAVLKAYPEISDSVSAMVLVGTTPRFTSAPHFPFGLAPKDAEGMRIKVRRNLERALDGFHRNLFTSDEFLSLQSDTSIHQVLSGSALPTVSAALDGLEALMEEDVMDEVRQVNCPVLLIHGEQDHICLPAASAWLNHELPNSHRVLIPGAGHAPFISCHNQFNQLLLKFIRQTGCSHEC